MIYNLKNNKIRSYILFLVLIGLLKPGMGYSQDVTIKIGIKDSIQSKILNENRQLIMSLPEDYIVSHKSYPVLFLLDGTKINLIDARLVTYNLRLEMIIVAISNTNRDRDMMPISRPSYKVENLKAENFITFLETE